MTIRFLYGNVGSSKTGRGVFYCIKDLLKGRRIFSNMKELRLPFVVTVTPMDLIIALDPAGITDKKLKKALAEGLDKTAHSLAIAGMLNDPYPKTLFLDEIGKWWDSRNHASQLNRFLAYFFDQCRKRNINVIITDQHASGFDIRGRQLTDTLIRCIGNYYENRLDEMGRRVPYSFEYYIMNLNKPEIRPKRLIVPAEKMKVLYPFYNTLEHIVPAEIQLAQVGET